MFVNVGVSRKQVPSYHASSGIVDPFLPKYFSTAPVATPLTVARRRVTRVATV